VMDKEELRKKVLGKLEEVGDREERGLGMQERFLKNSHYRECSVLFVYVGEKHEVPTDEIIDAGISSGKTVCVPKVQGDSMIPVEISDRSELKPGYAGIMEPMDVDLEDRRVEPGDIDLVVVPAVAFTLDGKRLGRGGGFYDRFLSKTDAYKIGLAYREQIVKDVPWMGHDEKVDEVFLG